MFVKIFDAENQSYNTGNTGLNPIWGVSDVELTTKEVVAYCEGLIATDAEFYIGEFVSEIYEDKREGEAEALAEANARKAERPDASFYAPDTIRVWGECEEVRIYADEFGGFSLYSLMDGYRKNERDEKTVIEHSSRSGSTGLFFRSRPSCHGIQDCRWAISGHISFNALTGMPDRVVLEAIRDPEGNRAYAEAANMTEEEVAQMRHHLEVMEAAKAVSFTPEGVVRVEGGDLETGLSVTFSGEFFPLDRWNIIPDEVREIDSLGIRLRVQGGKVVEAEPELPVQLQMDGVVYVAGKFFFTNPNYTTVEVGALESLNCAEFRGFHTSPLDIMPHAESWGAGAVREAGGFARNVVAVCKNGEIIAPRTSYYGHPLAGTTEGSVSQVGQTVREVLIAKGLTVGDVVAVIREEGRYIRFYIAE